MIKLKRIYEPKAKEDGYRVLVDRLWPRGISKQKAALDLWLKDIGPSDALRKWFAHDPKKWPEFQKRYSEELKSKKSQLDTIKKMAEEHRTLTLLYGARDPEHNQAVVIAENLGKQA